MDSLSLNQQKLNGRLTGKENFTNAAANAHPMRIAGNHSIPGQMTTSCNCWIQRDASFQVCQFDASGGNGGPGQPPNYRNDDWSTAPITLPFNICFYGQSINQIYINNNGNISIGAPYSTFTANSFPDPTYVMIAPFWADVDTRAPGSGLVYYSVSSTHLIVQWENVGYFNFYDDKLNTFQLIVTDGNDPILPSGQNISFCYKDMQWTTGDASGGTNGFGGVPATVGVNQGNGIDYIQFGLFDQAGNSYDGPFGFNDGVDWLDNQSFTMNSCISGNNIPPVLNALNVCDTIRLCENSVNLLTANYLSPEQNEVTNIVFNANGMTGINIISNTPGNTATIELEITGQASNVGFHTVTFTATDNGTPAGQTINNIVIEIFPTPAPSFTFSPASPVVANTTVTFTNTTPPGSLFTWDFGDGSATSSQVNPQHIYTSGGTYTVTLNALNPNGCTTVVTQQIIITQCQPPSISVTSACEGQPVQVAFSGTSTPSAIYSWDFDGGLIISGSGSGPFSVSWNSAGTYDITLSVSDGTCIDSVTRPITIFPIPIASIAAPPAVCEGSAATIAFNGTAGATAGFTWNMGNGIINSGAGAGPYTVTWNSSGIDQVNVIVTENGCADSISQSIQILSLPSSNFVIANAACIDEPVTITYSGNASSNANYNWQFSSASVINGSGQGPYTVVWNSSGQHPVSLAVEENGCISPVTSLDAIVNGLPVANAGPDVEVCSGSQIAIGLSPFPGENYSWSPATFLSNSYISSPDVMPVNLTDAIETLLYIQIVVDSNGCKNTDSVYVNVKPEPVIDFHAPAPQCLKDNSFDLSAISNIMSGMVYSWTFTPEANPSSLIQQFVSASYSVSGTFAVVLSGEADGCQARPVVDSIIVYEMPYSDFYPLIYDGCEPLSVPFVNTSTGDHNSYTWNFSDGLVAATDNPLHIFEQAGTYTVTLTTENEFGCIDDTIYPQLIRVYEKPVAQFLPNPGVVNILKPIIQFRNYSSDSQFYSWNFGDDGASALESPEHRYADTGIYTVTLVVISPFGCMDTISAQVRVEGNFSIYIPNAFTPNGDGRNDYFTGYGIGIRSYKMNIYNRWGELIFTSNDVDIPWDGKVNSTLVQNDVYIYRIELTDEFGSDHVYLGEVTLVR